MTEAISLVPNFYDYVGADYDDNRHYAVKTAPSSNIVMNGTEVCPLRHPQRFSFLFKFKLNTRKLAVTLFEIEGQMSIILDTCHSRIILNYGGDSCSFKNITLSLKDDLETGVWHKIGLAFADDHLQMFVNCQLAEWRVIPGCSIQCNADTPVSILTGSDLPHCSSTGEVCASVSVFLGIDRYFRLENMSLYRFSLFDSLTWIATVTVFSLLFSLLFSK